ncbi:MAG: DUF2796 domain-containing protein [Rubrivivax sp.]|nr:DUF2796 domain-containing protein [Rubrivivax sp.]
MRLTVLARALGVLALAALPGAPALANKAHQHGVATLDVSVEPRRVSLWLTTPLDNLVGFEREPRSDAERQRVDAALAALRDAAALWRIDPAAGCTPGEVMIKSAVLGLNAPAPAPAAKEGHADLEARWDFDCRDGTRTGFVEQGLFEAFARLSRLEVQAVTPRGQMKATLRKPAGRIALAR